MQTIREELEAEYERRESRVTAERRRDANSLFTQALVLSSHSTTTMTTMMTIIATVHLAPTHAFLTHTTGIEPAVTLADICSRLASPSHHTTPDTRHHRLHAPVLQAVSASI